MSVEIAKENNEKICGLCKEKSSKYSCPRCDVLYCSLDCYKSTKHLECSESFYRDCVTEELASHNVDDESKQKMMEILKRMKDGDGIENSGVEDDGVDEGEGGDERLDSDDDDGMDLEARIKDLNLDDADAVWNALTDDERNEFQAMMNEGDVGSIMPQWEPWWMFRKDKKLVEEVSGGNEEEEALKKCPKVKSVPELSSLTKVEPSPAIRFNIANVLASYAFIMRYYNGELEPVEAVACFLDICTNLNSNTNFDNPALAVEAVVQRCLQSELVETDKNSLNIMKYDIFLILQGPSDKNISFYCKSALSHLIDILTEAKKLSKTPETTEESKSTKGTFSKKFPDHDKNHFASLDISKVKKIIKKVEYYLSFVTSRGMELQ